MKRYRDFNQYLREIFGERVQKISLDAGMNCPNRDGTISREGCIYCNPLGSGTGAWTARGLSIDAQMEEGRQFAEKRYQAKKFMAYFQSFTNTYAPVAHLRSLYDQALKHEGVVALAVATRPDCVDEDILNLLASYKEQYLVWIEYGLQSAHDETLVRINRGHDVACFERAVLLAKQKGLQVCAHVILGLPGEDRAMIRETARVLGDLPVDGVKVHLQYVIEGTALARMYEQGAYRCLDMDEYVDLVADFLERLPADMVIQRLTGDPMASERVAPSWCRYKAGVLNAIRKRLKERDTWQGKICRPLPAGRSNGTG